MIKRLLGCVRQYKKNAIIAPTLVIFEVLMEVLIPFLMADLIDFGIDVGNLNYILKMGALLTIACLFSLLFGANSAKQAATAATGFAANLRHDMYHKVQDYAFQNIDKFSSASIVTRLTTDITNIQMAFQMIMRIAVRSPVMLISAIFMAAKINAKLSLIFFVALPPMAIGLSAIIKLALPVFQKVFRAYDRLNLVVQENLRGIRVVKAFVREDYEIAKFNKNSREIYNLYTSAERVLAFNMPLMQIASYTCMLLVAWFGARIIVTSGETEMTTGQLMSLITYAMQILISLMMLSMVFVMITISRASAERAVEILDEKSTIMDPKDPIQVVKNGDIAFRDVNFSYSGNFDRLSLKDISLEIKSGETIGIIGGTGSAKSTLVQMIPRLYDVSGGEVLVGDVDVRKYSISALRDAVSVVLQKNELFSGTIKDNLRWGNENATDEEIEEACRIACAHEFIAQFPEGYDTYIEQGGTNVSGGQKQRLCIARALLKKPKILILDDSTSAVDTHTDSKIRAALKACIPDTTKLIIAQRISSVQEADKIIVMDEGRIAAFGTHEELLQSSEIYKEVYESQTRGGGNNE
ncbi:MAG: ABC transporter ATP-binding protein [Oscillospiraceae bacterium]